MSVELDETQLWSEHAELTVIGSVFFHADTLASTLASLSGADFYDLPRGQVWDVCRARSADRKSVDPVGVARQLAAEDLWHSAQKRVVQVEMNNATSALAAMQQAKVVADLARRRELFRAVKQAASIVVRHDGDHSEVLAAVRAKFDALGEQVEHTGGTLTWSQLLDEFEDAHDPDAEFAGIDTAWPELNEYIGGLFGGRMYTVGGAPGDGKSTVALNIASYAAVGGKQVLVFSKEMPTLDVTARFVARGAEIDLRTLNSRRMNDFDRARYREFRKRTGEIPLRVNAEPVSIVGVQQLARAQHHRRGLDLLVVDYLQLMTGDVRGRSAEEEIAQVSTALKKLAMELDCAVVVPAQLNRNHTARADQRPTKADLRGSGRIEQDSDVVILLWRAPIPTPGPDQGKPDPHNLTFIIDKNRHGPKGEITLRWNGAYGQVG